MPAMQTLDKQDSLLTPIGYKNSRCGYCRGKSGSCSYYAASSSLSPDFYLSLLDRGWRRSGTTLYKPDLLSSCCPHYTIRLDSHAYHASRTQRQTLNRFNKYVLGGAYTKEAARLYPKSREEAKKRDTEFDLVERVHESEHEHLKTPPEPEHKFTLTLESDEFTEEKYEVFEEYQRLVHHESPSKISKDGFKGFLCTSPLKRTKRIINGQERQLGSYHQCYRLNGRLIALGVLDLLPQCVSAVYFIYHSSISHLSPGKLSALREIALAKEGGYKWWYAGFYIHSCEKMRYKAEYHPQYILDPETYGWDELTGDVKKRLDGQKYLSLSREREKEKTAAADLALDSWERPVTATETDASTTTTAQPTTSNSESKLDLNSDDSNSDSDSDDAPPSPSIPLYKRNIPGILTVSEIEAQIDLDHIKLDVRGQRALSSMLVGWEEGSLGDAGGIKMVIAELVAAVGVGLAEEMVVSF